MVHRSVLLSIAVLSMAEGYSQCTASFSHVANWDTVAFTNLSSTDNAHYYWNFGDGSTSYAQDPVHIFPESGLYLITLYYRDTISYCHAYYEEWLAVTKPSVDLCEPILIDSLLTYGGTDYIAVDDGSLNCANYSNNIDAGPAQNTSSGNWVYLGPYWETALWVNRIQHYSNDSINGLLLKREFYHTLPYQYDRAVNYDSCSANFEFHIDYQPDSAFVTFEAMSPVGVDTFYVSGFGNPIITAANSGSHSYPYVSYAPSFIWLIHHSNTYGGCTTNCTQTLVIRNPNYLIPPSCLIDPQPQDAEVNENGTAQFIISSQPGAEKQWQQNIGLGWQDLFDAGPYNGVNTDTLTISNCQNWWSNYQYRCVVTAPGSSCHNTSEVAVLTVTVGINELVDAGISVFPNPAAERLNLQWSQPLNSLRVLILDPLGDEVMTRSVSGTSTSIDIAGLSQGIYILSIRIGERMVQGRFIKQ